MTARAGGESVPQRKSAVSRLAGGALFSLSHLFALIGVEQRVEFFAYFHCGFRV